MKKQLMQFFALFTSITGMDMEAKAKKKETLELSAEEIEQVNAAAKTEGFAEKYMKDFNRVIAAEEDNNKVIGQISKYMEENQEEDPEPENEEEEEDGDDAPEAGEGKSKKSASAMLKKFMATQNTRMKKLENENKKLAQMPEGDEQVEKIKGNAMKHNKTAHSKTHLFAGDASWNAFEGRAWNEAAKQASMGQQVTANTDWNSVNIQKLNDDLGAYARKNATEIFDLLMDGLTIPEHWEVISGVTDEAVFLSVTNGDITQGYKAQWLPNNTSKFEVIKNKIFDIQIDATLTVTELKKIERSYLQMFFKKTSSPYKDDFVQFLAAKYIAKARKEDKIAVFKGVHYETPSDATKAGRFINKMDGMLKVVSGYRDKIYKSHALGKPTDENIYDYIKDWPEKLPYDFRVQPGLKLGLSDYWHKAYHRARERAKGTNNDYQRQDTYVEEYPNIEFVPHAQLEGQDFMYMTTEDNLGVMFNVMGEEGMLTMEKRKRDVDIYADYKFGFFIKALGATTEDGKPAGYDDQIFFSNDVEVLQDVYIPVNGNDATPSVKSHNALIIGSTNTATTNITKIDDVKPGQYVYLLGDSNTNKSTVKGGTNIILDGGDFALSKGNKVILRGLDGGKVIEVSRTEAGTVEEVEAVLLAADATTADASLGAEFVTQANTQATAITDIENAVAGEKYTIKGGSSALATTIANAGKFLLTAAITLEEGKSLTVEYNGTKFIEFARA